MSYALINKSELVENDLARSKKVSVIDTFSMITDEVSNRLVSEINIDWT